MYIVKHKEDLTLTSLYLHNTLQAHTHGRGGALTGKDSAKVTTLLKDLAVDKIGEGELTMKEAGAAMHAMMHRGNVRGTDVGNASKLAAGSRSTGYTQQRAPPQHQHQPQIGDWSSNEGRLALQESREEWSDLWQKWVSKLSEKGLLDGMPEGSAEREQQLQRAALKFLQCKAVVNAKSRRLRK
jgi:Mg-chelatase subunit ChlI